MQRLTDVSIEMTEGLREVSLDSLHLIAKVAAIELKNLTFLFVC